VYTVTQTAIQMEEKNRRLKVELVKVKNMPKQQLEESVRNLEEQNRALMRELERARTIVQARVTNAGMPSQGGVLEKIKKKKKKSTSKKSKKVLPALLVPLSSSRPSPLTLLLFIFIYLFIYVPLTVSHLCIGLPRYSPVQTQENTNIIIIIK